MKRFLLALPFTLLLVICVPSLHAQAPKGNLPPHQAALSWVNGSDPIGTTITGSNVYRCLGTCTATSGTFAVVNSVGATATGYIDTSVAQNTTYSWCVTNLVTISTGPFETACSTIVTSTVPKDAASSPSGLTVSSQ